MNIIILIYVMSKQNWQFMWVIQYFMGKQCQILLM